MNKDIQEKVNTLSVLGQNAQQLAAQRQQFQTQLLETESALEEIKTAREAYRIIGNIMVKTEPSKLKEDLESRKGLLDARIKSIETQEEALKEKSKKLQEEILSGMNPPKAGPEESVGAKEQKEKAARKKEKQEK
jgi:prefoldin beta subunit